MAEEFQSLFLWKYVSGSVLVAVKSWRRYVSILVFVEVRLRSWPAPASPWSHLVSILVFVEVRLRSGSAVAHDLQGLVSILVFVEVRLR